MDAMIYYACDERYTLLHSTSAFSLERSTELDMDGETRCCSWFAEMASVYSGVRSELAIIPVVY